MKLEKNFAKWQKYFFAVLRSSGIRARLTSTGRSRAEQAYLYTHPGAYPVAAPGTSQHEYGLAFDAVVSPSQYQSAAGQLWKSFGRWWDPSDPVHFAAFDPSTWSNFLASQQSGGLMGLGFAGSGQANPGGGGIGSAVINAGFVSTSMVPSSTARAAVAPRVVSIVTPTAPVSTSVVPASAPVVSPVVVSSSSVPVSTSRH